MRHQGHAENLTGVCAHLVDTVGELDAAALAAATGMDLRLDNPFLTADGLRGRDRFIDRKTGLAAGYSNPVFGQNRLALILVNFHC